MEIDGIPHKALRRFVETGSARGLPADLVGRLRAVVVFLDSAVSPDALLAPPNFGAHVLIGARAGTSSLTVTRDWRMTFVINAAGAIVDLDLEDYH